MACNFFIEIFFKVKCTPKIYTEYYCKIYGSVIVQFVISVSKI